MARKKIGSKKSKRISCGKRYKIEKKVKEHLKKVKKAKDIKIKKGIRGNRKEITVPNNCPFKEDILKKAQEAKEKKEQERQKQKEMQKKNREKLVNKKRNLESIVKDAESRAAAFERKTAFIAENAKKLAGKINVESSVKTFYREVKNVIEMSDVVIQVLDVRDPLGSRCKQLEEMVIACGKKLILLLNKIDLVPKENVEAWLKYLRNELPVLPFKACTQQQSDRLGITKISALTDNDSVKKTSTCLGSDMLLSLLNNYCRSKDIKTSITIGIVGFPNTGKSSIINSLKRSKACNVGSTPGVTKTLQVIQLDKHIKLIDSPGVVMATNLESEEEVVLKNCVRLENLEDPVSVVGVIMSKCNKFQLMAIYALPEFNSLDEFLELLAKRFGLLKKGGRGDLNKAAKNVIRDWNGGKITYYSRPPEDSTLSGHITTEVVQVMKEAFDIDSLFSTEDQLIKGLKKGAGNFDSVLSSGKVAEGKMDSDDKEEEDVDMGDDDDEEDDEEEEESDDDEKMDTATESAPKTVVKVDEKKAKKGSKEADKKVTFSVQLPGNQQLNKNKKQQFKQMQKKRKRSDKISDNLGSAFLSGLSM